MAKPKPTHGELRFRKIRRLERFQAQTESDPFAEEEADRLSLEVRPFSVGGR